MKKLLPVSAMFVFLSVPNFFNAMALKAEDHDSIMAKLAEKKDEHVLDYMTQNLNLTGDQQALIKSALENERKKGQDLHKEFEAKQKALAEETDKQITDSLSDEQKSKYPGVKNQLQNEEEQKKGQGDALRGAGMGGGRRHGGGMGR